MTPESPARRRGALTQCHAGSRLRLECLEDRSVPATFNVTTLLDGVVPGDGKRSLREAITSANNLAGADVIVLPAGVYKIALSGAGENANATGDLDVTGAVTIRGAGAGLTVIDGRQLDRVFDILGTAPGSIAVVLEKLQIRNGKVTGGGGGVQVGNANLVIRDSSVVGHRASGDGGGVSNAAQQGTGNVTLVRTTVARNVAGQFGGGVFTDGAGTVLTVRDSSVRRNSANSVGGGVFSEEATLTGCTISGNSAGDEGGGVLTDDATLTNCTVSGNTASRGGGIFAFSATLTNCTVSGNSANSFGGGVFAQVGTTLTNCTISGNTAGTSGGGVFGFIGTTLTNCTVVENIALTGGGLFHEPGGTFTLRNTLVALNLVRIGGTSPDVSGDFVSQGHNLIGDGTGATGFGVNFDIVGTSADPIDPKIGGLRNNGGPTHTHALLPDSPAIDRGDNAGTPATDQRGAGFARKKDGNGDGVAVVDIGAFER